MCAIAVFGPIWTGVSAPGADDFVNFLTQFFYGEELATSHNIVDVHFFGACINRELLVGASPWFKRHIKKNSTFLLDGS